MGFKVYFDPELQMTHLELHRVTLEEVYELFYEVAHLERRRKDGTFVKYGKLKSGRYIEVPYAKEGSGQYFIITGYDIEDEEIIRQVDET